MPHMYVNIPDLWSIWGVGINDEPPGTSILFIGCCNWMMNHIFTTKRGKTNQRSTKHLVKCQVSRLKLEFSSFFFREKSRPIKDFPKIPMGFFWGGLLDAPVWCSRGKPRLRRGEKMCQGLGRETKLLRRVGMSHLRQWKKKGPKRLVGLI